MRRLAAGGAALLALALAPAVLADSFEPIRLQVRVATHARAHKPLKLRVKVTADPSVLDIRQGPLRVRVKLASTPECGADFASTTGRVLLDKRLKPQPRPGQAYAARVKGKRKPRITGTHPLCVFLMDSYRVFASDTTDYTVKVRR